MSWILIPKGARVLAPRIGFATMAEDCTHDHVRVCVVSDRGVERMVPPADLVVTERPEVDVQGSGEWCVFFESGPPKVIHRWYCTTRREAADVARAQQSWRGGVVTVCRGYREVLEVKS